MNKNFILSTYFSSFSQWQLVYLKILITILHLNKNGQSLSSGDFKDFPNFPFSLITSKPFELEKPLSWLQSHNSSTNSKSFNESIILSLQSQVLLLQGEWLIFASTSLTQNMIGALVIIFPFKIVWYSLQNRSWFLGLYKQPRQYCSSNQLSFCWQRINCIYWLLKESIILCTSLKWSSCRGGPCIVFFNFCSKIYLLSWNGATWKHSMEMMATNFFWMRLPCSIQWRICNSKFKIQKSLIVEFFCFYVFA